MDLGEKYYKQDLLNYIHLEYYCVQSNCSKAELIKRLSYQDFKYHEAISVNVTTNITQPQKDKADHLVKILQNQFDQHLIQ